MIIPVEVKLSSLNLNFLSKSETRSKLPLRVDVPSVITPAASPIDCNSLLKILQLIQTHLIDFSFQHTKSTTTINLAIQLDALTHNDHAIIQEPSPAHQQTQELLITLANLLKIPQACAIDQEELEPTNVLERERFLNNLPSLLQLLHSLLKLRPIISPDDTITSLFLAIARFYPLDVTDTTLTAISVSNSCELLLSNNRLHYLYQILSKSLPPYFKFHPKINPESGRVLNRPLGGDRGLTDYFEEGVEETISFRREIGLGNVVNAVIHLIQKEEMEELWRFVLSPLLAYLDDFEGQNKLIGLNLLDSLLLKVNSSLLIKTGVGLVFSQSIASSFTSHTPVLLAQTHRTALNLFDTLYPPLSSTLTTFTVADKKQSQNRFESFCTLMNEGIVRVWEYKGGDTEIEIVLQVALSAIIKKLEIGIIRYLAIIIPHLTALISFIAPAIDTLPLYLLTMKNLRLLIKIGKDRIGNYREILILEVGKCWVNLQEEASGRELREGNLEGFKELEEDLKGFLKEFGEVDQISREVDLPRLLAFREVFIELVQ